MIISSLTLLSASPATADQDCTSIIVAAKASIAEHEKTEQDTDAALQKSIDLNAKVGQQLAEDESKLQSWTRNPLFIGSLGFLVGVLATGYALKK